MKKLKKLRKRLKNWLFPTPKLIMTILAKNEVDIIEDMINFHKSMGVDGFVVTDNNSSDGTREVFERYRERGWVLELIDEPGDDHKQSQWVDRMIRSARDKFGANWVINADADEFWFSESRNLVRDLPRYYYNVLKCKVVNVVPDESKLSHSFLCVDKVIEVPDQWGLAKYNLYTRSVPKVVHSTKGYKSIADGNHAVTMKRRRRTETDKITVFHFPVRSREQFKRKFLAGGAALSKNESLPKGAGAHWRYYYEGSTSGSLVLDEEFGKYFGMDKLSELEAAGHLRRDDRLRDFFADRVYIRERYSDIAHKLPTVLSTTETLERIIANNASVVRFGDAEFDTLLGINEVDPYQNTSPELRKHLGVILRSPIKSDLLIGIPRFGAANEEIENFRNTGASFWEYYCATRYEKLRPFLLRDCYDNALISRSDMFVENSLEQVKKIWQSRKVVIVASKFGRFDLDRRLFDNCSSIELVEDFPSTQTFSYYHQILEQCLVYDKSHMFLVAAGPTATVLCYELYGKGYQAIDIGHIDSSYKRYLGEGGVAETLPLSRERQRT